MVERKEDTLFIVISDQHPQTGKRERLSQVRAHITKQRFRKLRHAVTSKHVEARERPSSQATVTQSRKTLSVHHSPMSMEVSNPVPGPIRAMLNPASPFAAETTRRMHKCEFPHISLTYTYKRQLPNADGPQILADRSLSQSSPGH